MNDSVIVGERIKQLRKFYKLNQTDFAAPLGVSYGHISNIEKGKDSPSDSLIKLMAYEYNTTEEWINNGTGDMITHLIKKDVSTMADSNILLIELDDLLCGATASVRHLQENIIESIILLLKLNTLMKGKSQIDSLEILNKMLSNLYLFNSALQVSIDNKTMDAVANENRMEKLMDEIFENFSSQLSDFIDNYIKE